MVRGAVGGVGLEVCVGLWQVRDCGRCEAVGRVGLREVWDCVWCGNVCVEFRAI